MATAFPIDAAQIVGLFMERIFLVTFFNCLRVLLWKEGNFKPQNLIHYKMLVAALLMFLFASLDVAFHLRHNLDAFINFEGDPIDDFSNTSNWINVVKMGCYVAQTFIGDSILLYRCWIIYSKNWMVIALPIAIWLGGTVCGAMTIYVEATLKVNDALLNASSLVPFITSMLCLTLAMNVLTTCMYHPLMVHRIWSIRQEVKHRLTHSSNSPLTSVLVILIESGLMYTLSIAILFGLYMASNNGQYGVSNAVVQIIGITFNLIITSVDRGEATQPTIQHFRSTTFNSVPLHMINIQTSVSRYPPDQDRDGVAFKSPGSDVENPESSDKIEWRTQ
ncbi:hypothetical protein BDQ12DRAFT_747923 [Crucibulum laeve]|uniref:Uncharacterized protein n=1 Tax=Crucibulum laeve TaxID=68775 RepID=A0A5C3M0A2_9AGAR|nr:hypothetical protein BDQ12DRAFT_747923 [Crucibulum laeve]